MKDTQDRASVETFVRDVLRDIVAHIDEVDVDAVDAAEQSTSLTDDLGLESLDLAEMTVRIEDEYGVDVFEDDVVDTLGEVVETITTHADD